MRQSAILALMILACVSLYAQKVKTVSTTYTYPVPATMSIDEAERVALDRARIQAIADEFGTFVTQTNSTVMTNENGVTNTNFMTIGGSDVKGEWLEDIAEPVYEILTDGTEVIVRVTIKGKIREVAHNKKASFTLQVLRNGLTDAYESDRFMDNDDLYVAFSSPVSGFLAIYLLDCDNNAFCLLPYQGQESGIFETKANRKYLFFHPDYAYGVQKDLVEGIVVSTDRDHEQNRIVAVFSDNKFHKGTDVAKSVELPRCMSYDDFMKWLTKVRKSDPNLTIAEKPITIIAK